MEASMNRSRWLLAALIVFVAGAILGPLSLRIPLVHSIYLRFAGKFTVADRVTQFGEAARARLAPAFAVAAVSYPPQTITIAALKSERVIDVYAAGSDGASKFLRRYDVTAAS